jgi:hypothetical protein
LAPAPDDDLLWINEATLNAFVHKRYNVVVIRRSHPFSGMTGESFAMGAASTIVWEKNTAFTSGKEKWRPMVQGCIEAIRNVRIRATMYENSCRKRFPSGTYDGWKASGDRNRPSSSVVPSEEVQCRSSELLILRELTDWP